VDVKNVDDDLDEAHSDKILDPTARRRELDRLGIFDFIHVGIDELPDLLDKLNPTGLFYQPKLYIVAGMNASNEITPVLVDENRRFDMASSFGVATAIEIDDTDGTLGNATVVLGAVGEIWEIRSVSLTSNAGADYDILDDTVVVSPAVSIGAGNTGELVTVAPIPVAGASAITITNGLAADSWNIRAIRIL